MYVPWQVGPDGSQLPLNYRYSITPQASVNAYKPKTLDPNADPIGIRAATLGAFYNKKYNKIPTCEGLRVVWEAAHFFCVGFWMMFTQMCLITSEYKDTW